MKELVWKEIDGVSHASGIGHAYRFGQFKDSCLLYIEQSGTGMLMERVQDTPETCKMAALLHHLSIVGEIEKAVSVAFDEGYEQGKEFGFKSATL